MPCVELMTFTMVASMIILGYIGNNSKDPLCEINGEDDRIGYLYHLECLLSRNLSIF